MISTVEKVGKSLLKRNDVMDFKKEFDKLYSSINYDNPFFYDFFNSAMHDGNQFESFIVASIVFFKDFPQDAMPILNMVKTYCIPLALKINFILWVLNNYECNGEILKLIDLPYNDVFEKFNQKCHLDDNELKKVFEKFFSENDELFDLILKLRNYFQNSNILNRYIYLSDFDEYESEYYKKAIKSCFYIIKEIIFEIILFDEISLYDENYILKFSGSNSLAEGDCFDIKMIHASIKDINIIKIDSRGSLKYAWISSRNINVSQKKGIIIRIKGEFIDNGFGKYSKNMDFCSEKIDMLSGFNLPIKLF